MPDWLKGRIKNVSTDNVIFGFENNCIEVLLYKRAQNPSKGAWAIPGGFLMQGELMEDAARRILKDTMGVAIYIWRKLASLIRLADFLHSMYLPLVILLW